MITIKKFHLYHLKVSAHVKISVECFENFGRGKCPPPGCASVLLGLVWYCKKFCMTTSKAKTSPIFPLRCAAAQYHQIICAVKSDSRTLEAFENVGKARKQREAI